MENLRIIGELKSKIKKLEEENKHLKDELNYIKESPYLSKSIKELTYHFIINREEVLANEFGKRINEKHGTMFEIKTQAYRLAHLVGVDSDSVRIMVTEAVQNIIEHGFGKYAYVTLQIVNDVINPYIACSFKHELPPGKVYTLKEIEENALKGDITSEYFDFENSRGRGEFLMKEITDERRIINGIEINEDGKKIKYFKRILIKYRNPEGPREKINFAELKREIDKLDIDDVVCFFHIHHIQSEPTKVTVATMRSSAHKVLEIMNKNNFYLVEEEPYYRTLFATYKSDKPIEREQLLQLFSKIRYVVQHEFDDNRSLTTRGNYEKK